jgi:broad specificity phosphatase PhoE
LTAPLPTDLFVVRHAEVHNPKDILYGRLPGYGLSDTGRVQAEATARFLSTKAIEAIYTSPLLRARQTAQIISRYHTGLAVSRSSKLLETKTSYQGSPNSILKPGFSFYDPLMSPEDESMEEIFFRILRFLQTTATRHAGGAAVAVTHADPIAIMRVGLQGKEFNNANLHAVVYPMRASVTQLILRPGKTVEMAYFNPGGADK